MRIKIEDIGISEIYDDYATLKELTDKYYYTQASSYISKASDALMQTLRDEIVSRTMKEMRQRKEQERFQVQKNEIPPL